MTSPLDRPLSVTFFPDHGAASATREALSLRQLLPKVLTTTAPSKAALPWVKLAAFGDQRTPKGSLRHNANVQTIDGIEGDYDQEVTSVDEAAALLRRAGLAAMLYTSPSHMPDLPRWRVLCPTSKPIDAQQRTALTARLNGVLGGTLSVESFTLSQAYYLGSVAGNPSHVALLVDGRAIDEAGELDAGARYPVRPTRQQVDRPTYKAGATPDETALAAQESAVALLRDMTPGESHPMLLQATAIVAPFILSGHLDEDEAAEALAEAMADSVRVPNPGEMESAMAGALRMAQPYEPTTEGTEFATAPLPESTSWGHMRPTITVRADKLTEVIAQAEGALLASGEWVFQRGGAVVRSGLILDRSPGGETRSSLRIMDLNEVALREIFGRVAIWLRWDAKKEEEVVTSCPLEVPRTYLARGGIGCQLRVLSGVVHAPTLRSNGSILEAAGYDDQSGLLFDPRGVSFPPVPDQPTHKQAMDALALLDGLLDEFPFVDPQDRSVALSMILTGLVRRSLPTAPMHALTAPTPGTGKSYLVDTACMIATGIRGNGEGWRRGDDVENSKVLDAALLAGGPVLILDNVEGELRGARLAQALTQPEMEVRPLGESRRITASTNTLFVVNGNNLQVAADLTRRTLMCRLDAGIELPETRVFRGDPVRAVEQDRGRYVTAGLTCLRAFVFAGRPGKPKPLASYEAWSDLVRGTLLWLGRPDPVGSMDIARENDPRRSEAQAVLSQWGEHVGPARTTAAQVIERANQHMEFREALLAVAGIGGSISGQRLGKWLKAQEGKLVDGLSIRRGTTSHGVATWELRGAEAVQSDKVVPLVRPAAGDEFLGMLG